MNPTIAITLVRQRLSSPMRLVMLTLFFFVPLLLVSFMKSVGALHNMGLHFALILAAGAIGQEVSSGVLTLTFARPVSRGSYVVSRWFAAAAFATMLATAQLALGGAIAALRGGSVDVRDVLMMVLESGLDAFAGAAAMVLLSSLANGLGDLGIFFMAMLGGQITILIATFQHWTWLGRFAEEIQHTLMPDLNLIVLLHGGEPSWFAIVSVLSTIALGPPLATVALNRKELSYAVD